MTTVIAVRLEMQTYPFDDVFESFGIGSMQNYLTPTELNGLFKVLTQEFQEVLRPIDIGQTYEGN
jgi:carboxypeptidase T